MRWVNKAQNLFSWIPGAKNIMAFANFVLSTALNYIDEAVLSYIFLNKTGKDNAFKCACDGLVYYAQSWKSMLKGALKVGAFVWVLRIVSFIVFMVIFSAIGGAVFGDFGIIFGLLVALVLVYAVGAVIIDPYATCVMVNDYHKAIAGEPLKADLHATLCGVSKKFKDLFDKSKQAQTA